MALIATHAAALAAVTCAAMTPAAAQGPAALARAAEVPVLRAIRVPAAWRITRGKGVLVGVLDSGVDPTAPDLADSVITGPDETRGAEPVGYQPPRLHGTWMASLIAGHGSGPGRSEGIVGVAPAARILSVRVIMDSNEPGVAFYNGSAAFYDALAHGIRYAVRHGVSVINMSLGGPYATGGIRRAIGYAISHGVVVVAAAGNAARGRRRFTPYDYPASFTGVISVAAVNARGKRAPFSDRNSSVVVSAPGVNVPGAVPGGNYVIGSGTSPASALVAGVAALIRSKYPKLSSALVAQAIVSSTLRRPPGGYRPATGFGEVDAAAALAAAARLMAGPRGTGLAASAHFGSTPAAQIQVVHRSAALAWLLAGLALAALLCFAFAVRRLARSRPA